MPEEMKKYLMYQFLRRSSKKVLHFTADIVNPALKCDFLELLPTELSLNVIGNLDAKTLCRAAQVSKTWRRLIDSSETVWKRLFDANHYVLPEGELPRAIREGWGWQYASQPYEYEVDLSAISGNITDTENSGPSRLYSPKSKSITIEQAGHLATQTKRSKRKTKMKSKLSSRKHQKRTQAASINSMDFEDEILLDMASAEGPYAAARKAAAAISNPHVGLPSLKNLHLFKSIYMRHHLIRKTWMQDEKDGVSPRHIAFRAHQRHVVTCLQFDADKILTGSDDAKINVYDTKTGALRNILEGHGGGVWALQYEGNVLVSGSTDRTVRVWDVEKGECTHVFQGHTSTVRCLQILMPTPLGKTPDGRAIMMPKEPLIITGSRDSQLRVWKLPKPGDPRCIQPDPAPDESADCPYLVRALVGHHHSVRAIAAHADTLVSGSYDCSVRVWKISTGETVHRLIGHAQKVYSVVLDTKRNRCISGSMDNYVKVWSLDTGALLFNLEGHSSLVGLLDLQQDRLVSAAADSTLRIWDPDNGHCRSTLSAHTGAITCFQHDGQKVISGSDRTLKMWNVASGEFSKDLLTDLSGVWQVKFNERRCVAAVQRNNLTYIEVLDFGASRDGVSASKRGKRIVVNTEGQEVSDPHDASTDADLMAEDP
ncbi:F-box and WD-40 domain protein CDC4, partial [Lecanoromycetidae sp. Uapishka_2]